MNKHTKNALIALGLGVAVSAVGMFTGLIQDPAQNLVPAGEVTVVVMFLDFLSNFLKQEENQVNVDSVTPPTQPTTPAK